MNKVFNNKIEDYIENELDDNTYPIVGFFTAFFSQSITYEYSYLGEIMFLLEIGMHYE